MNVWKIVKKMLPFLGTFPFLRMLVVSDEKSVDLIALDEALNRLEEFDEQSLRLL